MRGKIPDLFLILNLTRSERQDEETKKRSAWKGLRRYAGTAALPLALLAKSAVHGHARAETFTVRLIIRILPLACCRNLRNSFSINMLHEGSLQSLLAPSFANSDCICK